MKGKIISASVIILMLGFFSFPGVSSAQMGMMGGYGQPVQGNDTDSHGMGYGMGGYGYYPPAAAGASSGSYAGWANSSGDSEINSALQAILSAQNIKNAEQIDCAKVTDSQFETLGDAYMGFMIPNQSRHEAMDNMMGGEGSESLAQAHINMGRSYLGCWGGYNSGPVYMPMMGYGYRGGFNGPSYMGGSYGSYVGTGYGMVGSYFGISPWLGWIVMVFAAILLALGIAAVARYLKDK